MAWDLFVRLVREQSINLESYDSYSLFMPKPSSELFESLSQVDIKRVHIYQPFKPSYDEFLARGFCVAHQGMLSPKMGLAVWIPTKQKIESLYVLGQILKNFQGTLVFVCENDMGAKSFVKTLKSLFPNVEINSQSKCKWALVDCSEEKKSSDFEKILIELEGHGGDQLIETTTYRGVPGIYGWNKIDEGSRCLIGCLPRLSGRVVDVGSGYGYLSAEILKDCKHQIQSCHLLEADYRAVELSKKNLSEFLEKAQFHWVDVLKNDLHGLKQSADFVVMNPPFHEGGDTNTALGEGFILSASELLKPSGELWMVCNVFLPYEKAIEKAFKSWKRIPLESKSFKVICAIK